MIEPLTAIPAAGAIPARFIPTLLAPHTELPSATRRASHTVIREYVTIHRGVGAESVTEVGDHCLLMGFVHVGHNSAIGNQCNIANNTVLGPMRQ